MGIFDFVKQGTQEMCIARPDQMKQLTSTSTPIRPSPPMRSSPSIATNAPSSSRTAASSASSGRAATPCSRRTSPSSADRRQVHRRQPLHAVVFFVKTMPVRGCKFGGTIATSKTR